MAFMSSSKILSIGKPLFSLEKYVTDRSETSLGGSMNKHRRLRRLHMSSTSVSQPKVELGVEVLVLKGNKVLLGRRRTTIGHGDFALPGGHLEFGQMFQVSGESFEECASREVKEETGLDICKVGIITICNNMIWEPEPAQLIAVLMRAALANPNQEPINLEPEKCEGWDWYDWNHLPHPLLLTLQNAVSQGLNPFRT